MASAMSVGAALTWFGHITAILCGVLLAAYAGGRLARALGQPVVIGEVGVGLLAGPALLAAGGPDLVTALLPPAQLDAARTVGHVGLVLFLVGVAHELRAGSVVPRGRSLWWAVAGSLGIPLAVGGLLAGWVVWIGDAGLRGPAPTPSFVLLAAIALSVTAVPVLSRILADQKLMRTAVARLAMAAAMVIDVIAWVLLALAIGLAAGEGAGRMPGLTVLVIGGGAVAVLAHRLLITETAGRFCSRFPRLTMVVIAACALGASEVMRQRGLTEIFGALLVGLAIPGGEGSAWSRAVHRVAQAGRRLVPVFFVVVGVTVFTAPSAVVPWAAICVVTGAGILAKVGGGYLGARLGGLSHRAGLQFGVMMNTRGLTEIVVLQAGYAAGILTAPSFLALGVMTLVTTAMTGPLCAILARPGEEDGGEDRVVREERHGFTGPVKESVRPGIVCGAEAHSIDCCLKGQ
ncbi:cation:proton antiporter [Streptosporangium sp. NPDC000396]|uniref:cation:proton antiporter n=1 Tax=Streptosporangium sp. NPDC000396 TaxID=3366185 RepID=UPI0036B692DA